MISIYLHLPLSTQKLAIARDTQSSEKSLSWTCRLKYRLYKSQNNDVPWRTRSVYWRYTWRQFNHAIRIRVIPAHFNKFQKIFPPDPLRISWKNSQSKQRLLVEHVQNFRSISLIVFATENKNEGNVLSIFALFSEMSYEMEILQGCISRTNSVIGLKFSVTKFCTHLITFLKYCWYWTVPLWTAAVQTCSSILSNFSGLPCLEGYNMSNIEENKLILVKELYLNEFY